MTASGRIHPPKRIAVELPFPSKFGVTQTPFEKRMRALAICALSLLTPLLALAEVEISEAASTCELCSAIRKSCNYPDDFDCFDSLVAIRDGCQPEIDRVQRARRGSARDSLRYRHLMESHREMNECIASVLRESTDIAEALQLCILLSVGALYSDSSD